MARAKFPNQTPRSLGEFWLPSTEDRRVPGMLSVDGCDVRLQVSPELTPMFVLEDTGPRSAVVKTVDEPDGMVILGSMPLEPLKVTLWDAYTTSHHQIGGFFFSGRVPTPSRQEMGATWCVVGEHLPDPNTLLFGVRPDVTNLAEWARIPALSTTVYPHDHLKLDWHMNLRNRSLDTELARGAGYLTLTPSATHRPPDLRGFHVSTTTQLELELFEGWSLAEIAVRVLGPLADLMTLLSGTPCVIRSLDVWANTWCSVHGYQIDPTGPETAGELLFTRPHVNLEFLPQWLEIHHRTTPVPQILAAVIRNEFPTVEADALSLATAVEALHRTLDPGARRFSVEQIDESLTAVAASDIPLEIADTVTGALRQYLYEYSYPQRVKALAEPVAEDVPGCIGHLGRWKKEVVDQRIALAHGLGQRGLNSHQIRQMNSLNQSLHWMLTLRLLMEAGIDGSALAAATEQSERFNNQHRNWLHSWPRIFSG
ncbi:HEPN domain-containing protein [Mycobacterium sherrisii]|uniref:ApeA N-terminal domain 1-containing protein n=1 Tax=Mycobacterium sherrisii TaxID=243061 RepID=UPI002DDDB24B|nr:HEPN domain-containing protein [Mycobacterium sherrisii]MEC4765142.1 HEPN domain-containing protein [Mycobacterium sherrisii]